MKRIMFLLCVILVFTACGSRKETSGVGENAKEREYIINYVQMKMEKLENIEKEKIVEFLGEEYRGTYNGTEMHPIYNEGSDMYTGVKDGRVISFNIDRKSGKLYRIIGLTEKNCEEISAKTDEEYEVIARTIAKEYTDITKWDMTVDIGEGKHPIRVYTFCKMYGDYMSANLIQVHLNGDGELFGISVRLLEIGDNEIEEWIDEFDEKEVDHKVIDESVKENGKEVVIQQRVIVQNGENVAMCYSFVDDPVNYCVVTME